MNLDIPSNIGVHMSHCCKKHGCKYGDDACPVVLGTHEQLYKQQCCDFEHDMLIDAYSSILKDMESNGIRDLNIEEVKKKANQKKRGWY